MLLRCFCDDWFAIVTLAVVSFFVLFYNLQNIFAPEEDPEMKVEQYERTFEQNEYLGLNDMKTENYSNDT